MRKEYIEKLARQSTLDTLKESTRELIGDNPTGLIATAGLGGLAGYLADVYTRKKEQSLLRSLLFTGAGAALGGLGYIGANKVFKNNLNDEFFDSSKPPLFTFTDTGIAGAAGLAAYKGIGAAKGAADKLKTALTYKDRIAAQTARSKAYTDQLRAKAALDRVNANPNATQAEKDAAQATFDEREKQFKDLDATYKSMNQRPPATFDYTLDSRLVQGNGTHGFRTTHPRVDAFLKRHPMLDHRLSWITDNTGMSGLRSRHPKFDAFLKKNRTISRKFVTQGLPAIGAGLATYALANPRTRGWLADIIDKPWTNS